MSHEERLQWMALWAVRNHVALELEGECGLGRECVGILTDGKFPDYDEDDPDIFIPCGAYHKHPCVAVLGRGEEAEAKLYAWLKWFDEHGYTVERGVRPVDQNLGIIGLALGMHKWAKMVKKQGDQE